MHKIDALPALIIGRRDDSGVQTIYFDCSPWAEIYPALSEYRLEMSINGAKFAPLRQSYDNGVLTWTVSEQDTAVAGAGRYEITATGEGGQRKTSASATVYVDERIPGAALGVPPDYVAPLLDRIAEIVAGGGNVTPEQIQQAVDNYLAENPVKVDEQDPTVPDWAKQPGKPTYTAQEVGALPANAEIVDNTARQGVAQNTEAISQLSEEIDDIKEAGMGGIAIDATLTQAGKAADAKAVGDVANEVSDILEYAPAQSKNLNVTKYVSKTISGVTIKVNDDGSLSLSGTATAAVYALTADENRATRFILYPGTYHLSGTLSSKVRCYLSTYADAITSTLIRSYSDGGTGLTFVIEAECYGFVQVNISNGENVDGLTMKIQMEKGTAATEYVSPWAAGKRSARLDDYGRRLAEVETEVVGFPVPEYYFESDYLPGRVAAVKAKMQECMGHGDAFIFLTDAHWHQNAQKSPALLNYISKHLNINKFIGGGDTGGEGGNTDFINTIRRAFPGRIYHTMGNHEYFYPATGSLLAYNMSMYNDDVHTGDPDRNYYYFDNNRAHIRYIVLDSYAPGLTSGGESQPGYEAEQRTWLENTALDVQDGWTIVVFTHHMYYMNLTTLALTNPTTNGQATLDILDAYNANASSKGKVACVIQGHTHYDRITRTNGGIPVVIVGCDKYQPWIDGTTNKEPWLSTRVAGTITEQAFDIVVLDKQEHELHFFRIGGDAFNGVDDAPGEPVNLRTVSY